MTEINFNPFMGRANNVTTKVEVPSESVIGHFFHN